MGKPITDAKVLRAIRQAARGPGGEAASATVALGLLLATIGRLEGVIRPVFELCHRAIACDTLGYFWADAEGAMTNAYCEQPFFLRADVVTSCMRYQQAAPENWPSFNENVLTGPVSGYLQRYQTPDFYRSVHFAETYAQIGAHHILDAVVHDGAVPRGCFLMMRGKDSGPFSAAEIEQSRRICDMLLLTSSAAPPPPSASRRSDAGRAIALPGGALRFVDSAAHQSLWMLTRQIGGAPFGTDEEAPAAMLTRALGDEMAQAWATGRVSIQRECPWGCIEIDLVVTGEELLVSFSQIEPYHAELARRLARSGLAPAKIIICWLLVAGAQRKQIAALMEISMDTLSEHISAIYKALGVRSATELAVRLVG